MGKYQKANDKLLNFSEERLVTQNKLTSSSHFLDGFFFKILDFVSNKEMALIIKEIYVLEGELSKLNSNKTLLEKSLSEFELDYKFKLGSQKESNSNLVDLRRLIERQREEFQNVLSCIRETNIRKSNLLDEMDLNAKIHQRSKSPFQNRSFEIKAKQNFKENFANYNSSNKMISSKLFNETAPLEKNNSYYETFKQMKRTLDTNLTNKTAPTVIFSPSNEANTKIAKMLETDQKEIAEKFNHTKNL